jgi:hypothetical protein
LEEQDGGADAGKIVKDEESRDVVQVDAEQLCELEKDAASHEEEDDERGKAHVAIKEAHALQPGARSALLGCDFVASGPVEGTRDRTST